MTGIWRKILQFSAINLLAFLFYTSWALLCKIRVSWEETPGYHGSWFASWAGCHREVIDCWLGQSHTVWNSILLHSKTHF